MGNTDSSTSTKIGASSSERNTAGIGSGEFMSDQVKLFEAQNRSQSVIGEEACGCGSSKSEPLEKIDSKPPAFMSKQVQEWEESRKDGNKKD